MILPTFDDIYYAKIFLTDVWDAHLMLPVLFGLIALLTVGFYALRRVKSALPRR